VRRSTRKYTHEGQTYIIRLSTPPESWGWVYGWTFTVYNMNGWVWGEDGYATRTEAYEGALRRIKGTHGD